MNGIPAVGTKRTYDVMAGSVIADSRCESTHSGLGRTSFGSLSGVTDEPPARMNQDPVLDDGSTRGRAHPERAARKRSGWINGYATDIDAEDMSEDGEDDG